MKPPSTHYDILQVPRAADPAVIHQAYRRLSQKYHPDKHAANDPVRHEHIQKKLNQAYAVLSDPQRRLAYDRQLRDPPKTGGTERQAPPRVRSNTLQPVKSPSHDGSRYRYGVAAAILAFVLAVGPERWAQEPPPPHPIKVSGLAPMHPEDKTLFHAPLRYLPPPPPTASPPPRYWKRPWSPLPPPPRRFEEHPRSPPPQRPGQNHRWSEDARPPPPPYHWHGP